MDEKKEIIKQQLFEFSESIRRAVGARDATIICNFDGGYTCTGISNFNPNESDPAAYVHGLLSLAQTVLDTGKQPAKIFLRMPNGGDFSDWLQADNFIIEDADIGEKKK